MNDLEPLHILQIDDETELPRIPGLLGAIQGAPLPSSVASDPQRSSCRGRRSPKHKHQDVPEHQPRYRDLGHLERNVAAVADDLGTDLENALLAIILADATNLGLTRMAAASQGVTRDQLIWIADAYILPETYKKALARIINAHHALPIASLWGDGTTSSSDGQFFRSAKRGDAVGEINAHYGHDPGLSLYTHLSDQHGPTASR
jgi:hypothetical protein